MLDGRGQGPVADTRRILLQAMFVPECEKQPCDSMGGTNPKAFTMAAGESLSGEATFGIINDPDMGSSEQFHPGIVQSFPD